jgi:hypothetical protein
MDRRGFLKNFGIGAAGVAVPTTVLSQTSDEFDIDKWEDEIGKQVNIFTEKVNLAMFPYRPELLPTKEYVEMKDELRLIWKHITQEEHFPMSDISFNNYFKSLIKFELMSNKLVDARKWFKLWKNISMSIGDEFMRLTQEEADNLIYEYVEIEEKILSLQGYDKNSTIDVRYTGKIV